ncbi:thioesterase [Amycolatopsis sp. WAC 01375]|uniref:alpha/beta fold hydrolase n=1 Tax=unclassified Amycolatopsis TaxID=2618356 RepID=UPI000F7A0357|nr:MULTISPECIES: alpha/beta fold hydrolase [unclassified Amycolatopsis]RSM75448.1 thioesterase [Amycolatopsis sp. WAC 01375]RSN24766.1 thioesterase [Amycolatopsis sp. WAC 01416]
MNEPVREEPPSRLVTLVRRKDRPVCVMLPGAGGGLNPYLRLASHLGRHYSVYAVRAAGLVPGEPPEDSIAAMAESALSALGDRSPALVFGWSLGGTVGWEMCVRLADRGSRPDLVIVDSSPLPRHASAEDDERIRKLIVGGLGPRPDEHTVARVERTFRAQAHALAGYAAEREYPGRALLLMCRDADDGISGRTVALRRWCELAPDLRTATLDAGHYDVFEPRHLDRLTGEVDAFLGLERES